jgi:small-conductance mechanosensitive channel
VKFIKKLESLLFNQETWSTIGMVALRIAFIILLAVVVVRVGKIIIRRLFKIQVKGPLRQSERREKTLLKLLENALSYVVYFSAILAILSEFIIDIRGLLAGAGVLGLAVGFGAQSLVKDVITGFFILFEDQFSVGDYVKIGTAEGVVEEIGLRTTKIKSFTGEIYILPNGTISQVVNFSMKNSLSIVDVKVPYTIDLFKTEKIIEKFLLTMPKQYDDLIDKPTLLGVQNFTESEAVVRITAETKPMRHYEMARIISIELKKHLDTEGIDVPYPVLVTKPLNNI